MTFFCCCCGRRSSEKHASPESQETNPILPSRSGKSEHSRTLETGRHERTRYTMSPERAELFGERSKRLEEIRLRRQQQREALLQGASVHAASERASQKVRERGEKLADVREKASQFNESASEFAELAKRLAEKRQRTKGKRKK